MIEKISAPAKLLLVIDNSARKGMPYRLKWGGKTHKITHFNFYHVHKAGRTYMHIFEVSSDTTDFRISINGDTLECLLEEISDAHVN